MFCNWKVGCSTLATATAHSRCNGCVTACLLQGSLLGVLIERKRQTLAAGRGFVREVIVQTREQNCPSSVLTLREAIDKGYGTTESLLKRVNQSKSQLKLARLMEECRTQWTMLGIPPHWPPGSIGDVKINFRKHQTSQFPPQSITFLHHSGR